MPKKVKYTLEEIHPHNDYNDGWVIIKGNVYNLTPILDQHNPTIKAVLGQDGTEVFKLFHGKSGRVKRKLAKYKIGVLRKEQPRKGLRLFFGCCR